MGCPARSVPRVRQLVGLRRRRRRHRPTTTRSTKEKLVKFNQLIANCALHFTTCDITSVVNALFSDSHRVDLVDLATVSPLITHTIRRFGDWHLDLTPPEPGGDGHLAVPTPRSGS
ncbi:MAG: Tn3 family transposase [Pseudonocardiaceae bacterium]